MALAACVGVLSAEPAGAQLATRPADPENGRRIALTCEACHGSDGIGVADAFPNLAGQRAAYLAKTLRDMREAAREDVQARSEAARERRAKMERFDELIRSRRSSETMDPFVVDLTDQDIKDVSAYYAGLPCVAEPSAEIVPQPRIAERCVFCHGERGVSDNRLFPTIAGQKAAYLERQLKLFRAADRGGEKARRTSNLMDSQAGILSDRDIEELARYYAAQPCR